MAHSEQYKIIFKKEPPVERLVLYLEDRDPKFEVSSGVFTYTTIGWEARKNIISLIAFLSTFSKGNEHIIINGITGNGAFLLPVIDLFRTLTWEIWGVENLNKDLLRKRDKIWVVSKQFETRGDYLLPRIAKNDRVFLISFENDSRRNQMIYQKVKPNVSLLNFQGVDGPYLDGTLMLKPWNDPNSVETFLIPNGRHRNWELQRYREQIYQFNLETRPSYFPHNVVAEGLDHCFDCTAEVKIWELYLLSIGIIPNEHLIGDRINLLTELTL